MRKEIVDSNRDWFEKMGMIYIFKKVNFKYMTGKGGLG